MSITVTTTYDAPNAERISQSFGRISGSISTSGTYATGGFDLDLSDYFKSVKNVMIENDSGYLFKYDYTNKTVKAYRSNAATSGVGASHNHVFTGGTDTTSAGASHNHVFSGGTDTTNAGASHNHVFSGGTDTTSAGASHNHVFSGGTDTTSAGASHNHAFTGTAIPPYLVVEEAVTVTTHVGTLAHTPLYIVAIHVTAGSTTGAFNVIPDGETPLTKQCAVTWGTGTLTFLDTDAVTAASVSYIPVQAAGPFASTTLVVDEAVVAAAAKTELANRACAIQYVWDDTDGVLCVPEPVGEAPTATHNCVIDITNATPTTDIDSHGDDEGNTLKVTYLKYTPMLGGMAVADDDTALTSEAVTFGLPALYVPGFGTQVVGEETGTGNENATWEGPSGTAADGVAVWNPHTNTITTNNTSAFVTLAMPFIAVNPLTISGQTPAGTNAAEATHTHTVTPTGTNAAEAAHTHTVTPTGTNAAEATHTHTVTPTGTNAAEATHTHTVTPTGTNAAEATHTHSVSAAAMAEVSAGVTLTLSGVRFVAEGFV